jgi:Protein kinase domain
MIGPGYLGPGDLLAGRYEIVRELGRGGYSIVYLATDRSLNTSVAIKLLVPPPASAQLARERLRREVQAVRGLAHTNIVGVHDFLEEGAWSFVVMEYVNGPDLAVRVRERGPLAPDDAARLGADVAGALSAAHRHGILHRDVKPQNILLDPDGRGRLTDFGAARLEGQATVTQTGALVGTLPYLGPEVLAGKRADARTDVYGLGVTLYYALVGRLPDSASPHLPPIPAAEGFHPRAVRPDLPVWIDTIVARATTADPTHRYHSASSLLDALTARDSAEALPVTRPPTLDFCLLCGSSAAAGLASCPDCRGVPRGRSDTLVFVSPPAGFVERRSAAGKLAALLAGTAPGAALGTASAGRRALVRVPDVAAPAVMEQLRLRGVPVRSAPAGSAWGVVPASLYALAATTLVAGLAASTALPTLLASSPVVAGLLVLGAHRAVQRPVLTPRRRRSSLPPDLDRRIAETLGSLPLGTARSLLADVTRIGESVFGAPGPMPVSPELAELLHHACDAARDLAALDDTLVVLEKRRESATAVASWADGHATIERARDRLVQQMLEALTVVGRLQTRAAASSEAAGSELAAAARDLAERSEADAAAMREVDALLR